MNRYITNTIKSLGPIALTMVIASKSQAQNTQVFIKLTDPRGTLITGDATARGFERTIRVFTTASSGKNDTEFAFTMPTTGAVATVKKSSSTGEQLADALVSFMVPNPATGALQTSYSIKMERLQVISCTEASGCDGKPVTSVVLRATRIGWTYYAYDKSGMNMAVSQKYGWDASTGQTWTGF